MHIKLNFLLNFVGNDDIFVFTMELLTSELLTPITIFYV